MSAHPQTPEEVVAIRLLSSSTSPTVWEFESCAPLPNVFQGRTFGGSSMALAVHAAYHTLGNTIDQLRLYSVMGNFLSPQEAYKIVRIRVTSLRSTRTFATRQVIISQKSKKNEKEWQDTFVALIDFIAQKGVNDKEKKERNIISFSAQPPINRITHHSKLQDLDVYLKNELDRGVVPKWAYDAYQPSFHLLDAWHNRYCPEGVFEQIKLGCSMHLQSDQIHLPMADRRSWDWAKYRKPLPIQNSTTSDKLLPPTKTASSAILFCHYLDTWSSMTIPWMVGVDWPQIEACATLDFAFRFHVDELDATQWHLRQNKANAANDQRNYVELQLWREREGKDFELVITLTELCILRGLKQKKQNGNL